MHWLYTDTTGNAATLAALAILYLFLFILAIAGYIIYSFFLMRIFDKAGVQGKWRAWVPVYNTLIFVKLGDLNPWWLLVLWGASAILGWVPFLGQLILIATFVYTLLAAWRVGLKLQKEAVWLILYFFLSIVWLGILAFDKSRWNTNIAPAPWAGNFLADKTVWAGIPQQPTAAVAGPGGPGAYSPPQGYQAPPQGYQAPPQGYEAPPQSYQPPPAGYQPPAAPPAAPPAGYEPPAAPEAPPAARPIAEPPTDPEAPRP